jgi:hypothetical protein
MTPGISLAGRAASTTRLHSALAFLRYRHALRPNLRGARQDMHDHIEVWVNESGAGGEDTK